VQTWKAARREESLAAFVTGKHVNLDGEVERQRYQRGKPCTFKAKMALLDGLSVRSGKLEQDGVLDANDSVLRTFIAAELVVSLIICPSSGDSVGMISTELDGVRIGARSCDAVDKGG
jgi:hypothetical protein